MMQATASIPKQPMVQSLPRILVNTRDNLLLMATKKFCQRSNYDRQTVAQYKDAFYQLIENVENSTKKKMAQYVSTCEYTPRQIALYLALEPLEISSPVLRQSTTLGQLDLIRIVELKEVSYAEVIATRSDIGPNLRKRLTQVESSIVQQNLTGKLAVPEQKIETKTKLQVAESAHVDSQSNNQVKQSKQSNKAEANLLEAAARGARLDTSAKVEKTTPTKKFGDLIEEAARAGNRQNIAGTMLNELGLSLETAHQVLAEKSGDTLAVLLNAHNVSAAQANRILMLSIPSIGLSTQNARRALEFYSRLNPVSSKTAVDQWPKDKSRGATHQSHLQDTDQLRTRRTDTVHKTADQQVEFERKTG